MYVHCTYVFEKFKARFQSTRFTVANIKKRNLYKQNNYNERQ